MDDESEVAASEAVVPQELESSFDPIEAILVRALTGQS